MSLSSSWQRLIIAAMLLLAGSAFMLSHPGSAPAAHAAAALPSYGSYYAPAPFRDLSGARPHQLKQPDVIRLRRYRRPVPRPVAVPSFQAAPPPAPLSAVPLSRVQAYALSLVGQAQFGCLNDIWVRESGWNYQAENPSGAYGIPQALPGSKMASAGADWMTDPFTQVRWGVSYIDSVYGSPCAAWSFWQQHSYY